MERINELVKLADHLDRKGLHAEANFVDKLIKKADAAASAGLVSRYATEMAEAIKTGDIEGALRKHSEIKKLMVEIIAKMPAAKKPEAKPLSREQKPSGINERMKVY